MDLYVIRNKSGKEERITAYRYGYRLGSYQKRIMPAGGKVVVDRKGVENYTKRYGDRFELVGPFTRRYSSVLFQVISIIISYLLGLFQADIRVLITTLWRTLKELV